jgi:protease IV
MSDTSSPPDFGQELLDELRELGQSLSLQWQNMTVSLRNGLRQLRQAKLDYVVMPVGGPLPQRDAAPRGFIERQLPLSPPPLSLETLNRRLRAVADADNVEGVVFIFRGFETGLATLQSFRDSVLRLREAGKTAVVYTPYLDAAHYFAATAADRIVIPPSAQFDVLGLRREVNFLKDGLNRLGLALDVVQISPYKSASDALSRSGLTPESREQITWLLDDFYDIMTAAMAHGRAMSQADMQHLIDQAPFFAAAAQASSLVDDVAYEDDLARLLFAAKAEDRRQRAEGREEETETAHLETNGHSDNGQDEAEEDEVETETAASDTNGHSDNGQDEAEEDGVETAAAAEPQTARLLPWSEAASLLLEKVRPFTRKFIAVVSLEGAIVMGPSRQPPIDLPIPIVGGAMAGEETLLTLLRQAEERDDMAALIFYVNSGGGSALASDLIGRQIKRIAQKKPVLVYMGDVAASGGYYVSAPAQHIMTQPATTTGSIGVIMGRLHSQQLLQKVGVNQESVQRGQRADLYSANRPMTAEEKEIFWQSLLEIYRQFKGVVAAGRDLPLDELDPICEGRVWTGRQAQGHGLVDSHGDFETAVLHAAEMAEMDLSHGRLPRVVNIYPDRDGYRLPQPFTEAAEIGRWFWGEEMKQLNGRPLLLMPFEIGQGK